MRKLLILLAILAAVASAQIDSRTRAYIHAMLKDSAAVMRGTIKDTATVLRTEIDGGESTLYGAIRDTIDVYWGDSIPTARAEMTDSAEDVWNDSIPIARAEMTDSANDVWNDSAVVILREDGSNALTGNWAAGDYDITGLERLAADTLDSFIWTAVTGGLGTAVINAVKVNVPAIECNYTSCLLDSFKLNVAEDTLFFFVGGKKFKAVP